MSSLKKQLIRFIIYFGLNSPYIMIINQNIPFWIWLTFGLYLAFLCSFVSDKIVEKLRIE